MKKLSILMISFLVIYIIYSIFYPRKINYVLISDNSLGLSINNINNYFSCSSVLKTYQDIKNNRTIRVNNTDYYLKKVLRESDVLIISVGMEELTNNFNKYNMKINYDYFIKMYSNIERLINEIKKYAYGKIIFTGYYNPTTYYDANIDKYFYEIDNKLNKLMIDNKIIYISLYESVKGNKKVISIIENYL